MSGAEEPRTEGSAENQKQKISTIYSLLKSVEGAPYDPYIIRQKIGFTCKGGRRDCTCRGRFDSRPLQEVFRSGVQVRPDTGHECRRSEERRVGKGRISG